MSVVSGGTPNVLRLRRARPGDAAEIARMSYAFRAGLGESPDHLNKAAVLRDGFGDAPEFTVILAELDGLPVGYALYLKAYEPNYAERGLYLADLFVDDVARRRGVGRALVAAVAAESRKQHRTFVWWVALAKNENAQGFYKSLGVVAVPMFAHAATRFDVFASLADEAPPVAD